MATFKFNRLDIAYDIQGEGEDFIFMHGLGADRRQTLSALAELSGVRLICVDMPGHGDTPGVTGTHTFPYSFRAFADIAIALLDSLSLESAIWGGISMGAGISLHVALRQPDRVKSLVLVRPAWLAHVAPPNLSIIEELGRSIAHEGLAAAETRLGQNTVYQRELKANPTCAASIAGVLTRPQALESANVLSAMVQDAPFDNMQDLRNVSLPALVIGNDGDPLHPAKIARTLAEQLRQGHYEHLPSRYIHTDEHHSALNQSVRQFLDLQKVTTDA